MRLLLCLLLLGAAAAQDVRCPAYPAEQRRLDLSRRAAERAARALIRPPVRTAASRHVAGPVNYIDARLFARMAQAGIEPAAPSADLDFLRRLRLDLTGRIPTPAEVEGFVNDPNPGKRAALIDSLLASAEFTDYWTLWFGNLFELTSAYYNFIGIPGRNLFHRELRDFVARDRSYAEFAVSLLTATGDSHQSGSPNFLMRSLQSGQPIQDTWDEMTNRITTVFLGVQTQCISCHSGRNHLENINRFLAGKRREDFWRQAAFLSRLALLDVPVDSANQQRKGILTDRDAGAYHVVLIDPGNPGVRPARLGGPYSAVYLFTGDVPATPNWRMELARMLTSDRQFARAAVNYLWAHFFRAGIVDPPNGWDLARLDPAAEDAQPSHPELLEDLASDFIAGGYRFRPLIRRMVESNAYQLSSRYPGAWRPEYARYFARQTPRRLGAEELYDAIASATATAAPMIVSGFERPVSHAVQLPDPTEPRGDNYVLEFMQTFGRGDWWRTPRSAASNVVQVLYLMNDLTVNYRTFGRKYRESATRVAQLAASNASDEEAVGSLFSATLGRAPSAEESAAALRAKRGTREEWLSDLQWALLNRTEFLFCF